MPTYPLLPQAQAYGYEIGVLLLDEVETHVPGDTAHAGTYSFPVLFQVVKGASATRITTGDPAAEADVVAAARELARMGVKGISSNCGFMLHYQRAVAAAVDAGYPHNADLVIDEGRPVLKRRRGKDRRASALALESALLERLPERGILDILTRTAYAIGWHRHFGPASGSDPKIRDALGRYVLSRP